MDRSLPCGETVALTSRRWQFADSCRAVDLAVSVRLWRCFTVYAATRCTGGEAELDNEN